MDLLRRAGIEQRETAPVPPLLKRWGMTVNYTSELWWVIGRLAVAIVIGVDTYLEYSGTAAFGPMLALVAGVLLYDALLLALLSTGRVALVFFLGYLLDTGAIVLGWSLTSSMNPPGALTNDMDQVLYPILIGGVARLGWRLGIVYTVFWIGWAVASTWYFGGPGSHDFDQLPIRILFLSVSSGLTMLLIARLGREKQRAVEAERQLVSRRDAFISVAAHELRSPLTGLIGFSEILQQRTGKDNLTDEQRRYLHYIEQESLRLNYLLEDLLDISRIHAGQIALRPEPVDLKAVADEVLQMAASKSGKHTFELAVQDDFPALTADRGKVRQVLVNLVDNAAKYSPDGGLVKVEVVCNRERSAVTVAVSDQGIGISEEDQKRLFNTFFRVRNGATRDIKGTGLGLYIVKSLVELMGGSIGVRSAVGEGTTFSFTIPARVQAVAET
jgi:signal transduction histidine kinase